MIFPSVGPWPPSNQVCTVASLARRPAGTPYFAASLSGGTMTAYTGSSHRPGCGSISILVLPVREASDGVAGAALVQRVGPQ